MRLLGDVTVKPGSAPGGHTKLALFLYFGYKLSLVAVATFAIYLGYRLFILGVTGEASLAVESNTLKGQLINAAPGLFFAVGGLISLGILCFKDINLNV